jgi:choline dehydrogenase-like flavoprotein
VSITDIRTLDNGGIFESDVCIVGGGVAGIVLAEKLGAIKSVSLIESGGFEPDSRIQSLYAMDSIGHTPRKNFQSRVRQLGGTSNLWPGRTMLLNEIDLLKRDWVSNSGWPISYGELLAYYEPTTKILKLPSLHIFDSGFYLEKFTELDKTLEGIEDVDFRRSMWAKSPERFGYKTRHYNILKKNKNINVFTHANLNDINLYEDGSAVKNFKIKTSCNKTYNFKSKVFIIACGGIENARVLLASNKQMVNGVGNTNDLLGRYYMDHPTAMSSNIQLQKPIFPSSLFGMPIKNGRIQDGVGFSRSYQKRNRLLNNYVQIMPKMSTHSEETYETLIRHAKRILNKDSSKNRHNIRAKDIAKIPEIIYLLTPQDLMPHFVSRLYAGWKNFRGTAINTEQLVMVHHLEQEPIFDSRVFLNNSKDELGMNRITLDWQISDKSVQSAESLQQYVLEGLAKSGYIRNDDAYNGFNLSNCKDASHHMGTTRMGDNSQCGVVDKNCKIFDIDNLYIAGSSVFPTSGHANPTLTIVALSLRLADHIFKKIN